MFFYQMANRSAVHSENNSIKSTWEFVADGAKFQFNSVFMSRLSSVKTKSLGSRVVVVLFCRCIVCISYVSG